MAQVFEQDDSSSRRKSLVQQRRQSIILTDDVCDELAREELAAAINIRRYEEAYKNVYGATLRTAQRRNSVTLPLNNFTIFRRFGSDPCLMGFLG
jgi:hypothetical protein